MIKGKYHNWSDSFEKIFRNLEAWPSWQRIMKGGSLLARLMDGEWMMRRKPKSSRRIHVNYWVYCDVFTWIWVMCLTAINDKNDIFSHLWVCAKINRSTERRLDKYSSWMWIITPHYAHQFNKIMCLPLMMQWRQSRISSSLMLTDIEWRANIYKKKIFCVKLLRPLQLWTENTNHSQTKKFPKKFSEFLSLIRVIQQLSLCEAWKRQPQN